MFLLAVRVVVSLGVVLGLFWLAARAGSRRFSGGSRTLVRVRGRQPLSRTASLAVVEIGSRVLVVGVGDGGVRLLTELDPTEIEEPATAEIPDAPERPAPAPLALNGSVLSAQTWKQAWAAATSRAGMLGAASGRHTRERDVA